MDNKEIYKKIEKLLYENGIIANAEDMGETIEMDSIMFVSLIVSIEEVFFGGKISKEKTVPFSNICFIFII